MTKRFGFTLIELMVCLIVITVLATMTIPQLNGPRVNAELTEAARNLNDAARYAHLYATLRQQTCKLVFSIESQRSTFELLIEDLDQGGDISLNEGPIKKTTLPRAVAFGPLLVESDRREIDTTSQSPFTATVWFYPEGGADAAALQITNHQRTFTVLIDPHTGRSELIEAAVSQTPNLREDLDA